MVRQQSPLQLTKVYSCQKLFICFIRLALHFIDVTISLPTMVSVIEGDGTVGVCATISAASAIPINIGLATSPSSPGTCMRNELKFLHSRIPWYVFSQFRSMVGVDCCYPHHCKIMSKYAANKITIQTQLHCYLKTTLSQTSRNFIDSKLQSIVAMLIGRASTVNEATLSS